MNSIQLTQLVKKEMWNTAQIIFWGIIFLLFFSSLVDIVLLRKEWIPLLIIKFLLIILFYTVYTLSKASSAKPNFLLHIVLLTYTIMSFFVIIEVNSEGKVVYFTLLLTVYLAFNTLVLWNYFNSLIHYAILVSSTIALLYFDKIQDSNEFMINGGYLFFTVAFISSFFPKIRMLSALEKIQMETEKDALISKLRVQSVELETKSNRMNMILRNKNHKVKLSIQQLSKKVEELLELTSTDLKNKDQTLLKINQIGNEILHQGKLLLNPLDIDSESTQFHFNKTNVSIALIYNHIIEELNEEIKAKNITLSVNIKNLEQNIIADEDALYLVIKSLIFYAVSFCKNNGKLSVRIQEAEQKVFFQIINKTNGLPSSQMNDYFKELQTIEYNKNNKLSNAQFDLSLAKKITEEMGGQFKYVSSIDLGYEFRIQFNASNNTL